MAKSKSELPISYLGWRSCLGKDAAVFFADREWTLASVDSLWKDVIVDVQKAPYVEQSRLFARSIAETTGQTDTWDADGAPVPLSRIENFLTIGCAYGELLCVDPSNHFSVWAFSDSGCGRIELLAPTLDDWMEQAEPIG